MMPASAIVCAGMNMVTGVAGAADAGVAAGPSPVMIAPFLLLLGAIAVGPFLNKVLWERWYPAVALGLGLVTVVYYVAILGNPLRMLHSGMEYISFIVLIGSLFVVAGGIHIRIRGKSKPAANGFLLALGAVLSNIVGTTGASMILIRPYIRVNRYRIRAYHIVFFIFIVSNMGGALTPIGDPPLFLGYLRGVPFFWVGEHLWPAWLLGMGAVLAVFYAIDLHEFRKLPAAVRHSAEGAEEVGEATGLHNIFFLAVILVAVFITSPPFLREALMLLAAYGSYRMTDREIHRKNEFTFHPVREVAILFLGIFATMVPALDWLELNAAQIGLHTPGQFYWATGSVSSVLDNAPTYLNFLMASIGLFVNDEIVRQVASLVQTHGAGAANLAAVSPEVQRTFAVLLQYHGDLVAAGNVPLADIQVSYLIGNHNLYLQAVSLSAVFFGAMTYIGNGPNFMVKSIAQHAGVTCPGFFGYIVRYSIPVLLPVFVVLWLLFFSGQG